jgi:MFS family permease
VLLTTVLESAVACIDATVVGIAMSAIGRDFGASLTVLQWVVTGYTLTLAGLLLFAGTLGDRYGRKRIFLAGVVWLALAMLPCGLTPAAAVLIGARAVQGVGAALLTPGSLATSRPRSVPPTAARRSVLGQACPVATAIGPFLGGWLGAGCVLAADLRDQPAGRRHDLRGERAAPAGVPGSGMTGRVDITGGILATPRWPGRSCHPASEPSAVSPDVPETTIWS